MKKGKAKPQVRGKGKAEVKPEAAVANDPSGEGPDEAQSIDRVRDILFGSQARQFEQKFAHLEALLQKEITNLREESRKRFDSLENYMKKEFDAQAEQIQTEQNERTDSVEDLSAKLNKTNKTLEKKISQLGEKVATGQRDLQGQILEQSKKLMDEIREKDEKLSAALDQSVKELRHEKIDRLALANLLTEVALRLKEEFETPGLE